MDHERAHTPPPPAGALALGSPICPRQELNHMAAKRGRPDPPAIYEGQAAAVVVADFVALFHQLAAEVRTVRALGSVALSTDVRLPSRAGCGVRRLEALHSP